jgi:ABC-type nitrate/sulfonate/bicarbonate transport system ATPase subunit
MTASLTQIPTSDRAAGGDAEPPLFVVSKLKKTYQTHDRRIVHALRDIDFTVAPKEFISIVGPSGCGKSTLLKILGGMIKADGGHFEVKRSASTNPKSQVGFVFQNPVLLPWRTILEDEPFGALDAMTRESMNLEILRIWRATSKTILFVTHSITESIFLADRVFVMTRRPGTLAERRLKRSPDLRQASMGL